MQLLTKVLIFLAATSCYAVHAQVASSGTTLVVGSLSYFVPGTPIAKLSLTKAKNSFKSGDSLVPFTFVGAVSGKFSAEDLSAVIANYSASDDVWTTSFLTGSYDQTISCVIEFY